MKIDIEQIGLTQKELQERVIDRIAESYMFTAEPDYDGYEVGTDSPVAVELKKYVKQRIEQSVSDIAEKHVLPNVSEYIENVVLQETNKWGEKTGQPKTFIEYLVARAESYLQEPVDRNGKTKAEANGFSWNKSQTRIAYMIDKHLHYSIESAMGSAVKDANKQIADGIQETVRIKLDEISKKIKVSTNGLR